MKRRYGVMRAPSPRVVVMRDKKFSFRLGKELQKVPLVRDPRTRPRAEVAAEVAAEGSQTANVGSSLTIDFKRTLRWSPTASVCCLSLRRSQMAAPHCSRSPSPVDSLDYDDIPPEIYEDIPESTESVPIADSDVLTKGICDTEKKFVCCPPPAPPEETRVDENSNSNKCEAQERDPDEPECMHGQIGVKALRDKINSQVTCSPKVETLPRKSEKTQSATREVRSHIQLAAIKKAEKTAPVPGIAEEDELMPKRFSPAPIRDQFGQRGAEGGMEASPRGSDEGIGGLQMSSENSEDSLEEGTLDQSAGQEPVHELQLSVEEPSELDGVGDTNEYAQPTGDQGDDATAKTVEPAIKVFSGDERDSQALTINDHARANLAAMNSKCTARMPAPPKMQTHDDEAQLHYSNEEIQLIADVLLNPKTKATADTAQISTPTKINSHMREALRDIHYSPTPRASSMLEKFRQRESGCKKVPTPTAPRGSILGCEPGRSLMPVSGLKAANMAALAMVNAARSPHKNNNTQHSRRSKMPNLGLQAANRAAYAELHSSKTRKLALFQQEEQVTSDHESCEGRRDAAQDRSVQLYEEYEDYEKGEGSVDMDSSAVIAGLQDSIDGLQTSVSSDDEARQGEESIYTSFTREPDSESDDEIYPEESQATAMDYQVQDKVAKIQENQVADQFVIYLWLYSIEHLRLYAIEMYLRLYKVILVPRV